jgi:hypothetical protein
MSVDNRTDINDCEDDNVNFSTTGGALGTNTAAGNYIEGAASVQMLHSNVYDHTYTVDDSGGTTLAIDMSDVTYYILVKANGWSTYSVAAQNLVLGDGTDEIGYATGGSDAPGIPLQKQFATLKLDCSDAAANPGAADVGHHVYAGVEANLDFANISLVGYGTLHSAKAQGNVANTWIDAMCYIANDSYALTINGGTVGTPETMADVVSDDEGGLLTGLGYGGLVSNPLASLFYFAGPTEWGNVGSLADSYFTAEGEQWYWVGDNQGGRAVGDTHFPFRVIGHADDTNSFVLNSVVIVNTGTRAQFDMSGVDIDICTLDGCSLIGLDTIALPDSTITTGFTTNCIFSNCEQITNNGQDMDGCTILDSIVAADVGALLYNEASDPDGTLDNLTIESGAAAHHAIDFGTAVDSTLTSITLRGIAFNGFGAVDDANASTVRFLATTGSLTLNLIDCTVDGVSPVASGGSQNFSVDDAAGMTVTVVVAPVTLLMIVTDRADDLAVQDVQTSIHLADSPFTELMNEDTTASGIASESYAGSTPVDIVWKTRKSDDLDNPRYFAQSGKGEITTAGFTQAVLLEENTIIP